MQSNAMATILQPSYFSSKTHHSRWNASRTSVGCIGMTLGTSDTVSQCTSAVQVGCPRRRAAPLDKLSFAQNLTDSFMEVVAPVVEREQCLAHQFSHHLDPPISETFEC